MSWKVKTSIAAVAALAVIVGVGVAARGGDEQPASASMSTVTTEQLQEVAEMKVFFGHQSVGTNVLDGLPAAYTAAGLDTPKIIETTQPPKDGAYVAHAYVGENEKPQTKLDAFDTAVRGDVGERVDAAFLKFCYVDITADTDVDALFEQYRKTMSALEADYPQVDFLHLTVPLTSEPSWKAKVKALLGKENSSRADNVARERFNTLIRQEYGDTGRVFDIAEVESTRPDGTRVSGTVDGQQYYALYEGYTFDGGHLNEVGAQRAAEAMVGALADRQAR